MTGPADADVVRYVVVVHGMGEPKQHSTLVSAISRFAEARRAWQPASSVPDDVVTLGRVTSATGSWFDEAGVFDGAAVGRRAPWVEFDGIPRRRPADDLPAFTADVARDGEATNLRFVSVDWFDITRRAFAQVGEAVAPWSGGLRRRLEGNPRAARWARTLVDELHGTIAVAGPLAKFRFAELSELVFDRYLGDVQVYAEFSECRAAAIRRFHDVMAQLATRHAETERARVSSTPGARERPARYVVVAHSLGSVMAWEALLAAHADGPAWSAPHGALTRCTGLDAADGPRDRAWVHEVDTFVTLGSPIDKFLTLFWQNTEYVDDASWMVARATKIRHVNLCEEQDPVGHQLDDARSRAAHRHVFTCDPLDDRVYTRSAIPGLAHVEYWNDGDVFRWILEETIDSPDDRPAVRFEPAWHVRKTFRRILFITYFFVPLTVIVVDHYTLNAALSSGQAVAAVMPSLVFFGACWSGRRVLKLLVWWRRILIEKRKATDVPESNLPDADASRAAWSRALVVFLAVVPWLWAAVTIWSLPHYLATFDDPLQVRDVALGVGASAGLLALGYLFVDLVRRGVGAWRMEAAVVTLLAAKTLICAVSPEGRALLLVLMPVFAPVGVGVLVLHGIGWLRADEVDVWTVAFLLAVVAAAVGLPGDAPWFGAAWMDALAGPLPADATSEAYADSQRVRLIVASLGYVATAVFTYTSVLFFSVRRRVRRAFAEAARALGA